MRYGWDGLKLSALRCVRHPHDAKHVSVHLLEVNPRGGMAGRLLWSYTDMLGNKATACSALVRGSGAHAVSCLFMDCYERQR